MVFTSSRKKQVRMVLYRYKNRRCTAEISHVNRNESNNFNKSNNDKRIGTSNLPHRYVQNESSFNTIITLQK